MNAKETINKDRFASPLRYPGGKACLAGFLKGVIELNGLHGCAYYEPYAGGAGAALSLLIGGTVSEIFINDADERIHAFWESALNDSEQFIEKVLTIPLSIREWHRQREICRQPLGHTRLDIGFSAFYMNRCNRSGVLLGAGPIGGFEQAGEWKLDVRFTRETLAQRLKVLASLKEQIHVSHLDAIEFLKTRLPKGLARKRVFVYLDPPYVEEGGRLYLNAYLEKDHRALADYISRQLTLPWLMSYDDAELIREIYAKKKVNAQPIRYSLQNKRTAQELIITPHFIVNSGTAMHTIKASNSSS
jgi:DNA adenine methylase